MSKSRFRNYHWRTIYGLAAFVLLFQVFFEVPNTAQSENTDQSGENDLVVFSTLQPYNLDIYLRENQGAEFERLTSDQANDYNPTFSQDGRWLLFCSERNGNPDIFAIELAGSKAPRPLTSDSAMEDAPSVSTDGKQIAFVSDKHGNADIFVMAFDPTDPAGDAKAVNLTNHSAGDFNPSFSPDGRSIAFSSDRDLSTTNPEYWRKGGGSEIYVMDRDGSNPKRLTNALGWDGSPSWSADGRTIYFYSERLGLPRIWRMNSDGSDQRPVSSPDISFALSPVAGPDERIFFATEGRLLSTDKDGGEIVNETVGGPPLAAPAFDSKSGRLAAHGDGPVEGRTLRDNGKPFSASGTLNKVRLSDRSLDLQGIYPSFPSLGPNSELVAATEQVPGEGNVRLVVSNVDGSGSKTIHKFSGQIISNAWSPNGEWISIAEGVPFASESVRNDIWKVRPDGSASVRLTDAKSNNAFPDFTGDGKRIVFRSGRDGNKEIYMMEADGSNQRRLTNNSHVDTMPAVSPDGSWIAYSTDEYALKGTADFDIFLLQLGSDGNPGAAYPGWIPGKTPFTLSVGPDMHPRFSPDGRWIIFASSRGGFNDEMPLFDAGPQPYGEIWAAPFPLGPAVRLTHNKWEESLPDWGSRTKRAKRGSG